MKPFSHGVHFMRSLVQYFSLLPLLLCIVWSIVFSFRTAFHVHEMSHLQKVIQICRFFVGEGGDFLTHIPAICGSSPV